MGYPIVVQKVTRLSVEMDMCSTLFAYLIYDFSLFQDVSGCPELVVVDDVVIILLQGVL